MADSFDLDLSGVPEVTGRLKALQHDIRRKGGRFALRKAANIVRDAAIQNAQALNDPSTPESIADNVAVRFSTRTFKTSGDLMFRVGIIGGANPKREGTGPGGDTWYWRLVEFGREGVPPRPFMRPALSDNIAKAIGEFVAQYEKATARAIRRAVKGVG